MVVRTHHDFNSHEPLSDCLIIRHVHVPEGVEKSFFPSGIPPKGYLFIRFAKQEFGHSLVSEQDVHLVSRTFAIGDSVKQHAADTMIGTVISIFDSYVLEPICSMPTRSSYQQSPPQTPFEFHTGFRNCDETCISKLPEYVHHPLRHALLYDVPGDELKRAADYAPGDYVVERDYLGIVQDHDVDAVLLLENNAVVTVEAWELELVVPNFEGHLVALPELEDLRRPDVLAYHVGGKAFIPTEHLSRGQFVITNHRNLRNGRWMFGQYDATCSPQGHVLDVRTRRAHVKWLCPNAYALSYPGDRIASALRPYDNLGSYSNPRDLRRTKGVTLLDRGQRAPRPPEDKYSLRVSTGQDLEAGDQVRFREPSGAFVKYQGNGHGRYNPVPRDVTCGYDMNEFIVFFSKQDVTVQWQDSSVTEVSSVFLKPYVMPEQELCPGDIINLKEGSTQVAVGQPETTATEFNEMIYFQGDYILRPEKVGVIQSVDARERLVRVRWFVKPMVRLLQQGNLLQRGAYFGPISDDIEDVSLYEIMAHPALMRKRRDLVILPPQNPPIDVVETVSHHVNHFSDGTFGSALLSWARPPSGMDTYTYLRVLAKPIAERDLEDSTFRVGEGNHHSLDWVGEILDLGLDGMLTIRLCGLPYCEEIQVPWERVLTIVDDEGALDFPMGAAEAAMEDELEDEEYLSEGSVISATAEVIEYEGGRRIDNESGEEGWSTDADDGKPVDKGNRPNLEEVMEVDTILESNANNAHPQETAKWLEDLPEPKATEERRENVALTTVSQQQSMSPPRISSTPINLINLAATQTDPPNSFLVLDTPPPSDQFLGPNQSSTTSRSSSSTFLKRIHREHRLLSTSLPLNQIYIRTYDSRLDLLRALILGPPDTPYESAPFLIDLYLPPTYPAVPPIAHFHSWTSGLGRINPNLYEEGKICLSLLGTWPGRGSKGESDTWSEKANLLQVLLSLMGLVLVKRPFYNEAGFEEYEAEGAYRTESLLYSEKAYVMARGFVRYALLNPVVGMEDVLAWLYVSGGRYHYQHQYQQGGGKVDDDRDMEIDEDSEKVVEVVSGTKCTETSKSALTCTPPQLLPHLIHRATALMHHSFICSPEQRDELVDGAGKMNGEAFIRPLSRGAVVMLRRHLEILERAFTI